MQEFHGDLLIGGMRIRDVHGELEQEEPRRGSREWQLSGHLHLPPEQLELLELNREYRIQLEDGRAGQVVLERIDPEADDEVLADFAPAGRRRRVRVKAR